MRNDNFSNDNLAIPDPYKTIFKMLAAQNGKKQNRYFIMQFLIALYMYL